MAFADFYDGLSVKVLKFFARKTWDGQVSLELTAETFAKAFENRGDFRGSSDEQAAAWLWAIARNELGAYWRERSVRLTAVNKLGLLSPHASDEEILRVEELAVAESARDVLQEALRMLHPAQRQMIGMRILEEREYDEIAERLGVSNQVVRTRISRALRSLRQLEGLRDRIAE
jgi:RNA polymerase sigma factor (sigma-70 family)